MAGLRHVAIKIGQYKDTMYDLQKASFLKRFSAYLLDVILTLVLATGFAWLGSVIINYDAKIDAYQENFTRYEQDFGISFEKISKLTEEQLEALPEDEKAVLKQAEEAWAKDPVVIKTYDIVVNSALLLITISLLLAIGVWEFVLPLILKNGQTVGKKMFGICLMRSDGIRVNQMMLFVRSIVGKFAIETMVPVYIVLMMLLGLIGFMGPLILFLLLVLQVTMFFVTKTRSPIHDLLAQTVAVDYSSQMIFDTVEELLEYKKKIAADYVTVAGGYKDNNFTEADREKLTKKASYFESDDE